MLLYRCHWFKLNLTWRMEKKGNCRGIREPPFHCHTVGRWWGQSAPCRDKRSPVGLLILRLYVHVMFHQLSLWEQWVAWCFHRTETPHFQVHPDLRCIFTVTDYYECYVCASSNALLLEWRDISPSDTLPFANVRLIPSVSEKSKNCFTCIGDSRKQRPSIDCFQQVKSPSFLTRNLWLQRVFCGN